MRIVVDTNVIVSALLSPNGRANWTLVYLAQGKYVFLYSQSSLDEIVDVLSRPRTNRGLIKESDVREVMELLKFRGEEVFLMTPIRVCDDPDDDKFLAIAVDGKADYIVSGDKKHLLSLNPFQGIPIISVTDFLELLR
jgi:putative PIN family toxin of toxin-antitoxin system